MQTADTSVKSPDTALLDDEMQAAIQTAIDSLPETQRMAIILRRYDDVSYEEIAEILADCVRGVIEDPKVEILCSRLALRLGYLPALSRYATPEERESMLGLTHLLNSAGWCAGNP